MSKGSKPRPVSKKDYDSNFDRIFGKWKSPLERKLERIAELEQDLSECQAVLDQIPMDDPDRERIELIVDIITKELEELN